MTRLAAWRCVLTVALSFAAAAGVRAQQREWWAVDLSTSALALMDGTGTGAATIGVLPLGASDPGLRSIADQVRSQLVWALQSVPHTADREIRALDPPPSSARHGVAPLTARTPLDAPAAARIGKQASTRFVVTGEVVASGSDLPSRVKLSLVDTSTAETLRTTSASFTFPGVRTMEGSRSAWRSKAFVASLGTAAALATGYAAVRANQGVKTRNAALLEVPPGATEEWARLHDEAATTARVRDFWWGVTIGLAGVTTSYLVLAGSPTIATTVPGNTWQIGIDLSSSQLQVRRSF